MWDYTDVSETEMATHSSTLAWKIPWMEEPGRLYSPWGCEELDTTKRFHCQFSLSCTGEGNGNPLECSCLENPRDEGAWWAAVCGVAQSWKWLKQLSSSSRLLSSFNWWWGSHYCQSAFRLSSSKATFQGLLPRTRPDLLSLVPRETDSEILRCLQIQLVEGSLNNYLQERKTGEHMIGKRDNFSLWCNYNRILSLLITWRALSSVSWRPPSWATMACPSYSQS